MLNAAERQSPRRTVTKRDEQRQRHTYNTHEPAADRQPNIGPNPRRRGDARAEGKQNVVEFELSGRERERREGKEVTLATR